MKLTRIVSHIELWPISGRSHRQPRTDLAFGPAAAQRLCPAEISPEADEENQL
jgi:hypothetical protein